MSRLPFDAGAALGGDCDRAVPEVPSDGDRPWTVTQLTDRIRHTLEASLPAPVRVVGEVANVSARHHWYFTLKDDASVVSCVAWASDARRFAFTPAPGDAVIATGSVSHYAPQGRTQLYVRRLERAGEGDLMARFRALCEELRRAGYFDEARKRPLPAFPRRVAVITSAAGAAQHDVIETARSRCPAVGILVVDARVQGEGAADSVVRAIRAVDRHRARLGVDAILVTRGGGSLEDLWAFNERGVADAVLASTLPVVAAIGHESDITIAELVADCRASTPTQAAVRIVPDRADLARQVRHVGERIDGLARRRVERARERLERLAGHAMFRRPQAPLELLRERVDELARRLHGAARNQMPLRAERLQMLSHRLARAGRRRVDRARERTTDLERRLAAVDPRAVLRRGFTYTTGPAGLVRGSDDVRTGDRIVTHLADGEVASIVADARGDRDQLDLFDDAR